MTASIQAMVRSDLEERERLGISRYGTALFPHNGRDALKDLYEELLDACCYVKQVMVEREAALVAFADPDRWYAAELERLRERGPA
jgi:hypothetical protein